MASHCAAQKSIDPVKGLIFYGFPLHALGRDSIDRASHLSVVNIPMLFLQGTNDKLANLEMIREVSSGLGDKAHLETFDSADHSFKVPKRIGLSQDEMIALPTDKSKSWISSLV